MPRSCRTVRARREDLSQANATCIERLAHDTFWSGIEGLDAGRSSARTAALRRTRHPRECQYGRKAALDMPAIRLKQCREGAMIYTINDTYIGRALDKYGEISRDEVLFLQQLTRPGMTVLEVARISVSSRCRSVGSFTPAAGSLLSSRSGSCIRCCVGISRSTPSTTSLHTTAQPAAAPAR